MQAEENGLVMTPFGLVPGSEVIEISANEVIGLSQSGHLVSKDKSSGLIVADYGEVSKETALEDPRLHARKLRREYLKDANLSIDDSENFPGYYVAAGASRIQSFKTTWVVPDLPTTQVNATFFLWNGLDGGSLQPVLQWGNNSLQYQIANWAYVGKYVHGTYIPVSPGTELTGVITYAGRDGDSWIFNESFEGYKAADLSVTRPNDASALAQCFEPYTKVIDYFPSNKSTAMKNIHLQRRPGALPVQNLGWWVGSGSPVTTPSGKNTVIASYSASDGEIDFYFH